MNNYWLTLIAFTGIIFVSVGVYRWTHPPTYSIKEVMGWSDSDTPSTSSPTPTPTPVRENKSPNDLSDTYGIVGRTIFNKKTKVVFLTDKEFFKDSGKKSFERLKYERFTSLPRGLKFVNGKSVLPEEYLILEKGK